MAIRVKHPNLRSLVLLSLLAIASAKVFFEERFDGIIHRSFVLLLLDHELAFSVFNFRVCVSMCRIRYHFVRDQGFFMCLSPDLMLREFDLNFELKCHGFG